MLFVGLVLRSPQGEGGVLEDKEKAQESIYIRRHEEEEMKKAQLEKVNFHPFLSFFHLSYLYHVGATVTRGDAEKEPRPTKEEVRRE